MDIDSVKLPILDGKNYAKWRIRMQCILEVKGLFLHRFNMHGSRPAINPIEVGHALNRSEVLETEVMSDVPYPELIGSILYLVTGTRCGIHNECAQQVLGKFQTGSLGRCQARAQIQ